jgi:hypothetical protein
METERTVKRGRSPLTRREASQLGHNASGEAEDGDAA